MPSADCSFDHDCCTMPVITTWKWAMRASPTRALRRGNSLTGYALLAPSLFGVTIFLLLPVLVVGWLSFQKWDLVGPITFAGLSNWQAVLSDPTFIHSLLVTLLFVLLVIPIQTGLGLLVAVLLSRRLA